MRKISKGRNLKVIGGTDIADSHHLSEIPAFRSHCGDKTKPPKAPEPQKPEIRI